MIRRYFLVPVLLAGIWGSLPEEAGAQWNTLLLADTMTYRSVVTVNHDWAWFVGYSGENSTVQVTGDGGETWAGGILNNFQIQDIAESNYAYVLLAGRSVDCDCGVLVRSTDGGSTWSSSTVDGISRLNDVTFVSATTAFIAGGGGLIMGSTDAGATWAVAMQEGDDVVMELDFPSVRTGYAVAGADGDSENGTLLYGSTDGGESWRVIYDAGQEGGSFRGVSFASNSRGVLAGYRGGPTLWITTDGGTTWSETFHIDDPSSRFRTVDFSGADTAYAAGDNGLIYASFDGGLTWAQERTLYDVPVYGISFRDGVGWAVGADGVRFKTVRTAGPEGYCIPPVTGPTYGSGLTFVGLDAAPAIERTSRGSEYYTWHPGGSTIPTLRRGDQHTVKLSTDPNNVDAHNSSRVWIDFNRDGDFDDPGEEVGTWDNHELAMIQSASFTVPLTAEEGETVMRVYTDMPSDFGHDEPNPCGYMTSENIIGHHGEVEDYALRIVNENTTSVEEDRAKDITVSATGGYLRISGSDVRGTCTIIDIRGEEIARWKLSEEGDNIDVSFLPAGAYFVRIETGDGSTVRRVEL